MENIIKDGKISELIKDLYVSLQDDVSRRIFMYRLTYFLENNTKSMEELYSYAFSNYAGQYPHRLHKTLEDLTAEERGKRGVILYGAGRDSDRIMSAVCDSGLEVILFCDKAKIKEKQMHLGIPVISPETLLSHYRDYPLVIASSWYAKEIYTQLEESGFPEENMYFPLQHYPNVYYPLDMVEQYFGEEFIEICSDEIYVDAGCRDGDTVLKFINECGGKYKKIIGFEPDPDNYANAIKAVAGLSNVEILPKGAWDCTDTLKFFLNKENKGASRVSDSGDITIETVSIDEIMQGEAVTFIKMDIEGSELKALAGAKETIKRYRPRLAICVYHKHRDIIDIPLYIKYLVPEYKMYLRHHVRPDLSAETVFYAVI